jgi:beta-galactosidase
LFVNVEVQNSGAKTDTWSVVSTIYDATGAAVGSAQDSGSGLAAGGWVRSTKQVTLTDVSLWNIAAPYLYTVAAVLTSGSGTVDTVNITIGIRNAYFDANFGFVLNGIPVKIQGFSQHQDFAGVGTAVPDRANRYRVDVLKSIGANGW